MDNSLSLSYSENETGKQVKNWEKVWVLTLRVGILLSEWRIARKGNGENIRL